MQTFAVTCFCLALISAVAAIPFGVDVRSADHGILRMLAEANAMGDAADPTTQYEHCVTVATEASANLTATAAQNRVAFVNQTASICSAFTTCNSDNDTLDFFNCYVTASSADILDIYTLSDSASTAALSLKSGLQMISDKETSCTSAAQRTYTTQTAETYKELYACFVSGLPGSTTAAASSTAPPDSSAADDSTASVASSAAPVAS